MPDCEWLQLLHIKYQTANNQHKRRQINEQTKQDKPKPNESIKNNLNAFNKTKQEVDYFIAGQGMESDRVVSIEGALMCMMNIAVYSQEMGASKALSAYRSKTL